MHNLALTHEEVARRAAGVAGIRRGAPLAALYQALPDLEGHAQEGIYPFISGGHEGGSNVIFVGHDKSAREAFERVEREKRLRRDWDALVKKHPFLSSVGFAPTLSVGKYALNPTRALYVVTELVAAGDERFAAAFVVEESTE
jgi:hypothetical protein